jgi:hypothetical protein
MSDKKPTIGTRQHTLPGRGFGTKVPAVEATSETLLKNDSHQQHGIEEDDIASAQEMWRNNLADLKITNHKMKRDAQTVKSALQKTKPLSLNDVFSEIGGNHMRPSFGKTPKIEKVQAMQIQYVTLQSGEKIPIADSMTNKNFSGKIVPQPKEFHELTARTFVFQETPNGLVAHRIAQLNVKPPLGANCGIDYDKILPAKVINLEKHLTPNLGPYFKR